MPPLLSQGVPSERDYLSAIRSEEFAHLREFSHQFLAQFPRELQPYANRWVSDPLHQWSRQWEYPFVLSRLRPALRAGAPLRVLDAGSGVSFFPYYLGSLFPSLHITCCDSDPLVGRAFASIGARADASVEFTCADLRRVPLADASCDAVYCISVLEHTHNYPDIVGEFKRILRPGGHLLLTFDISLDGAGEATLVRASEIMTLVARDFDHSGWDGSSVASEVNDPGVFTTRKAESIDASLLPWRRPRLFSRIKSLLTRGSASWPPLLTIMCLECTKKA
ncbi:MAG TPA: class I SAM-dependent methyltransferase [Candidatus Bathyarchaeia archaeon]|nr:class I SAM-dependent methyltransferase [Candidatus Bathyarchaeia archaeon]